MQVVHHPEVVHVVILTSLVEVQNQNQNLEVEVEAVLDLPIVRMFHITPTKVRVRARVRVHHPRKNHPHQVVHEVHHKNQMKLAKENAEFCQIQRVMTVRRSLKREISSLTLTAMKPMIHQMLKIRMLQHFSVMLMI